MNRKGSKWLWVSIVLFILLVIVLFLYFALAGKDYSSLYKGGKTLVNPAEGLTVEEAAERFDETFVYYLLVSIGAYNLHPVPLSSDTPKIELIVGEDFYNAEVVDGKIIVREGKMNEKDAIIKTSKTEAAKMVQDKTYISESFRSGGSGIELVASKSTLFGKGYLGLYTELTGESITGNVVRIYAG